MSDVQEKFIILKKMKYGEADLIIHALSSSGTKKSFIARSALKSKKRFGGGILEPSHFVTLTYKENQNSGLNILNEATLIDDFSGIRSDFDKLEFALFILNSAHKVSLEGDEDSHFLFNLVGHALRQLALLEMTKPSLFNRFKLHYCLKFLYQQGVIDMSEWMIPFLKINISESNQLDQVADLEAVVDHFGDSIFLQVLHYIKNADIKS